MLNDNIKPDILLDLAQHMGECARSNALNGRLILAKWLEKVHYAFRDAYLFPLLVDYRVLRIEVQYLDISEFFLGRLLAGGRDGGINDEDTADLNLAQQLVLCLQGLRL